MTDACAGTTAVPRRSATTATDAPVSEGESVRAGVPSSIIEFFVPTPTAVPVPMAFSPSFMRKGFPFKYLLTESVPLD